MSYAFSLVRFVPDPARGEFVNIGAIAGDEETGDWGVRWISNYKRARAIDLRDYLPAARAFTATLEQRVDESERLNFDDAALSDAWLGELAMDLNNVIQISDPAPIVATSAEEALDTVFDRLIVDPARATFRFKKKNEAQAAARRAYREVEIPEDAIRSRAHVNSGAYDFQFDFAVHNGQAVQLLQCWSFEIPSQGELTDQVKAWAWMAHEIKSNGGRLVGDGDVAVPTELDIAAIYVPPADADSPAFAEARSAFDELQVTSAEFENADAVGEEAASRLAAAAH